MQILIGIILLIIRFNLRSSKKWLDAQSEQRTTLRVFSTYLSLADLKCDEHFCLITVEIPHDFNSDVKPKLKVYKGTTLISEQNLPGIPSSVQTLYVDENEPKIPGNFIFCLKSYNNYLLFIFFLLFCFVSFVKVIAVAIDSFVYFYKNMKPYFKYTFPSLVVDPLEKEIWKRVILLILSAPKKTNIELQNA